MIFYNGQFTSLQKEFLQRVFCKLVGVLVPLQYVWNVLFGVRGACVRDICLASFSERYLRYRARLTIRTLITCPSVSMFYMRTVGTLGSYSILFINTLLFTSHG